MHQLIEYLVNIANVHGYAVRFDRISPKYIDLTNNSHVFYAEKCKYCIKCKEYTKHITIYHVTDYQRLWILAHEIGHIITKEQSRGKSTIKREFNASQWAINELRPKVNKGALNKGIKLLQGYFNSYLENEGLGLDSISLLEGDGD
jgi:hypothetical protein